MSVRAIQWAFEQELPQPSMKLVLLAFANYADENGCSYPGKSRLLKDTSLSMTTLKAVLRRLRDAGYIADTGERRGRTGQIVVYRLCTERGPELAPLKGVNSGPLPISKGANSRPERGQILDPERTVREPDDDDDARAHALAKKFFELRSIHFPRHEPCLTPFVTVRTEARQFLADGGTVEMAVAHLEAHMPRVAQKGRSPPHSLKFFRDSLSDELAKARETITFRSKANGAAQHETETVEQRRRRIIEMAKNGN